jgi:hypothetical protein
VAAGVVDLIVAALRAQGHGAVLMCGAAVHD